MWSLPLWVTCFQTEVCSRSTWQAEPQSHACLNLQGWLGKLISDLCLGKVLTHHGRNSPNTSWWSKELNVNKNDTTWGVIMRFYLVLVNRILLFSSQSHYKEDRENGPVERQDMTSSLALSTIITETFPPAIWALRLLGNTYLLNEWTDNTMGRSYSPGDWVLWPYMFLSCSLLTLTCPQPLARPKRWSFCLVFSSLLECESLQLEHPCYPFHRGWTKSLYPCMLASY